MRLFDFLRRNASIDPRPLAAMTLIGALSTLIVLALISFGAVEARSHDPGLRMLAILLAAVGLYVASQNSVMSGTAREAEQIIRRLRARLFDRIEAADLMTVAAIGRARLYAAMAHETQTLSRTVVLLIVAAQQAVTLVFVALFLAWLTLPGFLVVAGLGSLAILIHVRRAGAMAPVTERAVADERNLFEGFEHLLGGFKEVRVNALRARRLIAEIDAASDRVRLTKSAAKRRWGMDFVLVQVLFYALMGLMVFAVPMFDSGFARVALETSTVALFMIGPIATIAQAIPAYAETEASLVRILDLEGCLDSAAAGGEAEDSLPLDAPIREIAMAGAAFTYREADGSPGFTVGPLDAVFRAGEVVFVTGGNGSGKSTLLRLLTGLLRPDRGALAVNGAPLPAGCRQAYRDRIAAVLSDYHLFRRLHGLGTVDPARAEALLKILEIGDKVGIRDGAFTTLDLSGGQRKRLALLVAMLEDKPVLILDEWAADQDPHFRRKFYEEILPSLRRPDRIVVCVTHDERYFSAADRIVDMTEGRIRVNPPG
jgi:putative ATP-binding cassette transporter